MAGIRLEFAQFGHFTSFDVIRSMVSMASVADEDLPTPIATGLKTMYYVDSSVVEGFTYYYKVRVWRGTTSFVSSEVSVVAVLPDPNWHLTTLLLNANALPFVNSAFINNVVTNYGVTLSPESKFGSGCLQFGSGYLTAPASIYSGIGVGDFCMTAWVYPTQYPGGDVNNDMLILGSFSNNPNFVVFLTSSSGCLAFWDGTAQHTVPTNYKCPLNQWSFIEIGRVNGVLRMFVGGVLAYTANNSSKYYSNNSNANIGGNSSNNRLFKGRIDDLRFYKGWGGKTIDHAVPSRESANFMW